MEEGMYLYEKPDNLVELFENSAENFPQKPLFGVKDKNKKTYNRLSYRSVSERVDNLRSGLAGIGVEKNDSVGIISNNRPEWAIAAFATYGLGARFIPMYEAELPKTWKYIIKDSGLKVLFVSDLSIYHQVRHYILTIPTLEYVFLIEGTEGNSLRALEIQGSMKFCPSLHPGPDDTAMLIYTSGTTGEPKGVLLSHGNITSNIHGGRKAYPEIGSDEVSLSILPWAHTFGQTVELYSMILTGSCICFMESIKTVLEDIALVKPTVLIAVPKVFNMIYMGIMEKIQSGGVYRARIALAAFDIAARKFRAGNNKRPDIIQSLLYGAADIFIFSQIRKRFGGRLKGAMTGSAIMNRNIAEFFFSIGIPVYDCYGMTETSPGITMNRSYDFKLGTAGKVIDNVTVKIDTSKGDPEKGDGEIVVYGPNVMKGYHNKPGETRLVMTDDGGLRTGDRGTFDEDGFLHITGRIKEQFKLENGKYVFPSSIEEDIRLAPFIENIMIYGEGKPYTVGLVVPDLKQLQGILEKNNIESSPDDILGSPTVITFIHDSIRKQLEDKYGSYEIPRKLLVVREGFSVENGTLTQTLKLKRDIVANRYREEIQALYN